ncbi:MAG: serine hydrolase [Chitinophagales bacterium]
MKNFLLILFIAVNGTVFCQQPVFITDSLDAYVNREMQRWNIPAVAIAIVKDGKTVVSKGYGVKDIETKEKANENTLFMIASNTKLFTGTSLALLDHQNRISLEDKVIDYIPYFKMYDAEITPMVTIEDLLSHRLGFETFQGDFYNWNNNATRKEIIENIQKNEPMYQFRDTWGYCNAGFVTAGAVLEAVTDSTWDEFINTHFFIPMHMNRSSTTYEKIKSDKNACTPYTIFQNKLVKLQYDNLNNIAPCAAINSSVNDLSHWLLTQLNNGTYDGNQIFPPEVIKETRFPRSIVGDGHSSLFPTRHFDLYGLGAEMNDYEGREMIWHTGGADGFVTSVCFIPDEQLGITVLTNTDANYFFLACLYQIIEAYFQMPYRNLSERYYTFYERNTKEDNKQLDEWYKKADEVKNAGLPLKDYTGKYYNSVYGNMEIKLESGKLNMYFSHHPQLVGKLAPVGENDFVCTYDPINWGVKHIPFTVEDGKVKSLKLRVNDFIDFLPYEFIKQ